ncbi:hypothetical protein ACO0QE_004387 [Hanseniaspora vineae]
MLRTKTQTLFKTPSTRPFAQGLFSNKNVTSSSSATLFMRLKSSLYSPITLPNGLKYTQPTGLFINNEFVESYHGKTFEVINPFNEETITKVQEAREQDVEKAVSVAKHVFETEWKNSKPEFRAQCLNKLADLVDENAELLASIESYDNGKALSSSKIDVQLVSKYLRYGAGWCDKLSGKVMQNQPGQFSYTVREPLGVCGLLSSFNFPLMFVSWKLVPALVTANTCVFKPSEHTPLSTLYFGELIKKAGFPPGVVNFLPGFGKYCGNAICQHKDVKKVSFTGSGPTAEKILQTCGIKKTTMELGGKSASIITKNAKDLDKVVANVALGIFFNSGEVCCAGSRVYVQEDIYEDFLNRLKIYAENLKVGNAFDDPFYGPLTNKAQFDKTMHYIDVAKSNDKATLLTGGQRIGNEGYLVQPTIFSDATNDMRFVKEEIFGPVLAVSKFKTVEEAIAMANNTEYGLAAGVFTDDVNEALDISSRLEAGTVWVNTYNDFHPALPFGGHAMSGFGSEMGEEALHCYTAVKAVKINFDSSLNK